MTTQDRAIFISPELSYCDDNPENLELSFTPHQSDDIYSSIYLVLEAFIYLWHFLIMRILKQALTASRGSSQVDIFCDVLDLSLFG